MKSVPTGGKQIHQDKYKHLIHFSQSFINGNEVPNSKKRIIYSKCTHNVQNYRIYQTIYT